MAKSRWRDRRFYPFKHGMKLEDLKDLSQTSVRQRATTEVIFGLLASTFLVKRLIKKIKAVRSR